MTKLPSQENDKVSSNQTASPNGTTEGGPKNSITTTAIVNSSAKSNGYQPVEDSPVYVTSVPAIASASASASQKAASARRESKRHSKHTNGRVSSSDETRHDSDPDPYKSGDELELTQDLGDPKDDQQETSGSTRRSKGSARSCEPVAVPEESSAAERSEDELDRSYSQKAESDGGGLSESGDSLPGTPEKTYGLVGSRREVLLDTLEQQSRGTPKVPLTATSSGASSSSRKSGSSEDRRKSVPPTDAVLDDTSMIRMVEFDPAHREMAVDVPETFVARTKTPPRYPPPKHAASPHNNNIYPKKGGSGESSGTTTPLNGTLPHSGEVPHTPVLVQTPNSLEEQNRIRKYEDEIRLRRAREEEEVMLRSSLRSSQKLQSLASQIPPAPLHGMENKAYTPEDLSFAIASRNPSSGSSAPSPRISELIESLQRIQDVLQSNGHRINEDVSLVAQLFSNPDFQKVLAVHNKVQQTCCVERPPSPSDVGAQDLVNQVLHVVQSSSSPDASELVDILSKYSMEGLLFAHDCVASREPSKPSEKVLPGEATLDQVHNYQNDTVKIVRIDKTNEALGATIRNEGGSVIIGRIVKGGAAEKSGQLHEGDEILEVNNVEVRSKDVNDVCEMLAGMKGTLTFIIVPNTAPREAPRPVVYQGKSMHVKAHFNYDPETDPYIPCRELGMSFQKGDILHVISQEDENWWQAYREGEEDQTLAGLVPSKKFQEQQEAMRQTYVSDTNNKEKSKKSKQLLCAKKTQKKKKKKMLYSNYNDEFDNEEILTYEEVATYYPKVNYKRPVVLIGPPNIGRHELRQKLMEDRERFAAAVPHTSRPRRDREVEGVDYHFITRADFERAILNREFVEHGEFEKAYYGTSFNSIRDVVKKDKICVLNLHPLSLKLLKNSDLMPFVVFVAPPNLDQLRQKKRKLNVPFKDEDLKEIIEKAREMEDQFDHYFDLIIINQDVESAYQRLLHEINMLEREPQWVPSVWLDRQAQ